MPATRRAPPGMRSLASSAAAADQRRHVAVEIGAVDRPATNQRQSPAGVDEVVLRHSGCAEVVCPRPVSVAQLRIGHPEVLDEFAPVAAQVTGIDAEYREAT